MSLLLQRARASCPPSLLEEAAVSDGDQFYSRLASILDPQGTTMAMGDDPTAGGTFLLLLEKAVNVESLPAPASARALEQRRCLLLAVAGATPRSSQALEYILANDYLAHVKKWLSDITSSKVGGVDLLLHLLTSIVDLPVTKAMIKDSGVGKAVGAIEKHSICVGSPNEKAIKERVDRVKDVWKKLVKAKKEQSTVKASRESTKRPIESVGKPDTSSPQVVKKIKSASIDDSKKSFSTLLKKVSSPSSKQDANAKLAAKVKAASTLKATQPLAVEVPKVLDSESPATTQKKNAKRVKWADHFGGALSVSQDDDTPEPSAKTNDDTDDATLSWSDRKKRDRIREKELLANVKKAKLLDDDEEEDVDEVPAITRAVSRSPPSVDTANVRVQPSISWQYPSLLDVPPPSVTSHEQHIQTERMANVPRVSYSSDLDVPSEPAPLTGIEQALDMSSQTSTVTSQIPFFIPQEALVDPHSHVPPITAPAVDGSSNAATVEFVQSLGLPLFLVGFKTQALQTLVSTPGLLNSVVDANGMYDEQRLISLVTTLGSNAAQPLTQPYESYGMPPFDTGSSHRGGQSVNRDAGNLHVSGFGPMTTEADLINLFAPYVQVEEVVMKNGFAFVNSRDPENANIAREALEGTMLGGTPIRINAAQRKGRDGALGRFGNAPSGGNPADMMGGPPAPINVDTARDDRGNPATKNLFVAGYGPGTTEQQLREVFGHHATVIGVVMKSNFAFVNTADKVQAVQAREALIGTPLNGGSFRINFAKETGRLGTSFDITYNASSGPNAPRMQQAPSAVPQTGLNYYGRGY